VKNAVRWARADPWWAAFYVVVLAFFAFAFAMGLDGPVEYVVAGCVLASSALNARGRFRRWRDLDRR
jgi:NhaP-type Na+/H+ or K+/H+ antiporter